MPQPSPPEMPMPRFICLLLLISLPAGAGVFDNRPASAPLGQALNNSADFLPVRDAFRLSLLNSSPDAATLRLVVAEGYYLYRHQFKFSVTPAELAAAPVTLPEGQHKRDPYFGDVRVFHGPLEITVPLNNPGNQPLNLSVTYQGCADKGLCYPPETEILALNGGLAKATVNPAPSHRTWRGVDLLLMFAAGLALTFTPCVLPMLPILSGVVLRGQPSKGRGLLLALAYVLPMAACYALLGALMGLFGAQLNLQAMLQSPWVLAPFALFFALFALAMFGSFELRLPGFIRERLDRRAARTQGGTISGAATLGVLSSLIVSPCISAPFTALLLYISSTGDVLGGALQLFALGLGMGTPLVIFAAGGGALLPRTGNWMIGVRNAFGVMLLAVSLWLLERILPGSLGLALWGLLAAGVAVFLGTLEFTPKTARGKLAQLAGLALLLYALAAWTGALQGHDDPLRPLATGSAAISRSDWRTLSTPSELDAALAQARLDNRPLLLDWYADWCISCKRIEREVLGNPSVASLLSHYQLVRFDMTDSNHAQRALLDRYQLFGPPAIQLFAANGQEWQDLRVVGEIDAEHFARRLRQAAARF
jgi:thiol:disulfide interchange protein DsbD